MEEIEEFGRVTHCTVLPQCNEAGLNTAFARSGCESVRREIERDIASEGWESTR